MSASTQEVELLAWTPEMVKSFWDYYSGSPELFFACRFGWEITHQVLPYLPRDGAILDYGCGPGCLIQRLLDCKLQVAGLDFSSEMVDLANRRFRDRPGFMGAFEPDAMNEKEHTFAAAIAVEVVEHLYDDPLNELLDNLARLVRPGGTVVLTTPNEEDLADNYVLCPLSGKLFHRWQHVRSWSGASLGSYLEGRGFSVESTFTTDFTASFHTEGSRHPLKQRFKTLKKRLKYRMNPDKRRPHLVAIARTPA